MEDVVQVGQLLNQTLSPDSNAVLAATEALDRFSLAAHFPFSLLTIAIGGEDQGQRVAAATYFKNLMRRNIQSGDTTSKISKELKDQLMQALLQAEGAVLKVLLEAFRIVVVAEFVKQNSWRELVSKLLSAIENSNLINGGMKAEWRTLNTVMILHAVIRPFQYFLNPKVAKEPVPPQLDLIAKEILVPLLALFRQLVGKILAVNSRMELEVEKVLLVICKCIYFAVRSHMPSALAPLLPLFCDDLFGILSSLHFDCGVTPEDGYLLRLKTGKRSLLIFCVLVTRHRKYSDKLMPDIVNCALKIAKYSSNISKLDFLSERIISLAFDVISHVLETGPGWRLVSSHFSYLLDSAIFPVLVLNEKDISEWGEDVDEYMRKNLPSELEEVSGWREDLFTARKSARNLLGLISVSKGPPVVSSVAGSSSTPKRKKGEKNMRNNQRCSMGELLVIPFLSKFPIPSDSNASKAKTLNDYFGVLMAYGGLQDYLKEQNPGYTMTLLRTRVLPLYYVSHCPPQLIACANWILGEFASCLSKEMSTDVYSSLLKALAMSDNEDITRYPVRVSAAGALAELLENDYLPPEWLPLLQAVIGRIGSEDEENIILFQLLMSIMEAGNENVAVHIPDIVSSVVGSISKCMHQSSDPWPQVVERGFEALAVMTKTWESCKPEEVEQNQSSYNWAWGQAAIAKALSALLQQAWLTPNQGGEVFAPSSCIDYSSALLHFIMLSITKSSVIVELKLLELLLAWADLVADWHSWDESEDLAIFDCITEVVSLHNKYGLKNFLHRKMPAPPAPPVSERSIIEGLGIFVSEAILQYPSATSRACSCVHILLHVPSYSSETEGVKQALVIVFSRAAFSHFQKIRIKPCSLWKPLLLAISSCYLCFPDIVEEILEEEKGGFAIWASSLASACTCTFEPGLSEESEIKLGVLALAKVVERVLELGITSGGLPRDCFISLIDASIRLKEVQEEMEDEEDGEVEDDENSEDDEGMEDEDEDSQSDDEEETEEQFLERYAKVAVVLENGTVIEEGDLEDQEYETNLGSLEQVDQQKVICSLMEKYRHLIRGQSLPLELVLNFLHAFPECNLFFQGY